MQGVHKEGGDSPGLVFELQWRNQPDEVSSKIGIWGIDHSSLNWTVFKSYLAQSLGTADEVSVAYLDSDGDELPIESECEFQEALKFARHCSKKDKEIVLKLEKHAPGPGTGVASNNKTLASGGKQKCEKTPKLKTGRPGRCQGNVHVPKMPKSKLDNQIPALNACFSCDQSKAKCDIKDVKEAKEGKVVKEVQETKEGKDAREVKKCGDKKVEMETLLSVRCIKRYMEKLKAELIKEVKVTIKDCVDEALKEHRLALTPANMKDSKCTDQQKSHVNMKKKKYSDEDLSDGAFFNDQRDIKLLKKIEKLHRKGEKKFEKLDSKLEKLENKTKRLLEKKSQSKSRSEKLDKTVECVVGERKARKLSKSDIPMSTCLMNATQLLEPCRTAHVEPGEQFLKVWHVANSGTLPWTDKTELCLSWGTPGLRFDKEVIKCPPLEPGEEGAISVCVEAPNYAGTFESYWHFHHMGARFGHWIDCAVIVGLPGPPPLRPLHQACENTTFYNKKEMEEKVLEMAELAQELHDLQMTYKDKVTQPEEEVATSNLWGNSATHEVIENQRKIAANMVEIQKRLDDISLLHTPPSADKILEMAFGTNLEDLSLDYCGKKDLEELENQDDLIDINHISGKNIEPAEWIKLQAHPEFLKRVPEFLLPPGQTGDMCCTLKRDSHQAKCEVTGGGDNNLDKPHSLAESHVIQGEPNIGVVDEDSPAENGKEDKGDEVDSESDSELSVISNIWSVSESEDEDLNFLMVRMPSTDYQRCPSSNDEAAVNVEKEDEEIRKDGAATEDMTPAAEEGEETAEEMQEKSLGQQIRCYDNWGMKIYAVHPNGFCEPVQALLTPDLKEPEVTSVPCSEPGAATLRRSRHGDYETKSKKLKSNPGFTRRDTKYHFKASQLYDKVYCAHPAGPQQQGPVPFTFTGTGCCAHCGRKDEDKRQDRRRSEKPRSGGKVHAPIHPGPSLSHVRRMRMQRGDRPVDILPDSLMHGAFSVASSALNTARSVFTNLQTAFAMPPEERPPPRGETASSAASSEALFRLYEMGFTDLRMNRKLLKEYGNDVLKVIEELVGQPCSNQPPPAL